MAREIKINKEHFLDRNAAVGNLLQFIFTQRHENRELAVFTIKFPVR